MPSTLYLLAVFVMVLAAIPLCLWLLKRSPWMAQQQLGLMKVVQQMPLGPGQRLVVVEVQGQEAAQWLVLGVTAHHIQALHQMPAQAAMGTPPAGPAMPAFAQWLSKAQKPGIHPTPGGSPSPRTLDEHA